MAIDIRTLTTASLIAQLVLIALVFGLVYLARKKRVIRLHDSTRGRCRTNRNNIGDNAAIDARVR